MSIGLYDMDLANYSPIPLNLELMKIADYYSKRGEIVVLSPSFTPERHQLFYIRKDYIDNYFPPNFWTTKNVIYGGLAFSNNRYSAMEDTFELRTPNTLIYRPLEDKFTTDWGKRTFNAMINGEHCRISTDGITVNPKFARQFRSLTDARLVMFHDQDLNAIQDGYDIVKRIIGAARHGKHGCRIGMKFPVQVCSIEGLLKWTDFKPYAALYSLRYNGIMEDDCFNEFLEKDYDCAVYRRLEYNVTLNVQDDSDFLMNDLPHIYHQVLQAYDLGIRLQLTYGEYDFKDKTLESLIDMINFYQGSRDRVKHLFGDGLSDLTMFDYVSSLPTTKPAYLPEHTIDRDTARQLFQYVLSNNQELFKEFYTSKPKDFRRDDYDWTRSSQEDGTT